MIRGFFDPKRAAAAEAKIAHIATRAKELDNGPQDKNPAVGEVDAYVPSQQGGERIEVSKQGDTTTYSQAVSTTRRKWLGLSKHTDVHIERYAISGNSVQVSYEDKTDTSYLFGAIRFSKDNLSAQGFSYQRN
jgi:hypothetical protein